MKPEQPEQQELTDALCEIESQIVVALYNLTHLGSQVDKDWSEQLKYQLLPAVDLTRAIRRLAQGRSVQELRAGFGSPGDYGTNTRLGKALTSIYSLPKDERELGRSSIGGDHERFDGVEAAGESDAHAGLSSAVSAGCERASKGSAPCNRPHVFRENSKK
mgnify:CR=1 FL=1